MVRKVPLVLNAMNVNGDKKVFEIPQRPNFVSCEPKGVYPKQEWAPTINAFKNTAALDVCFEVRPASPNFVRPTNAHTPQLHTRNSGRLGLDSDVGRNG
jgi:hypothetical protein